MPRASRPENAPTPDGSASVHPTGHVSERARIGGRHELGQNFLVDRQVATDLANIIRHAPPLPVLELGAGAGAITRALAMIGQPVTAVELDPAHAADLRRISARSPASVRVVTADLLTFDYGPEPHHVVSNVPFGITTPLLRRLLAQSHWHTAALLLQWEVARKRAAVGGTTLLTATWWHRYTFTLARQVPASAFRPRPNVSAGILVIQRRDQPLIAEPDHSRYQRFVKNVFTSAGRSLSGIVSEADGRDYSRRSAATTNRQIPARVVQAWQVRSGVRPQALPRDLSAEHWVSLFRMVQKHHRPR